MLSKLSKLFYGSGRASRDVNAVCKAVQQGSPKPILKRIFNKLIGRKIVSKLWLK